MVPQIKVWTECIISTLSSKERVGDLSKSTSMLRKSAKSLSWVNSKILWQMKSGQTKVVKVVFNIIPTRTLWTIWQVWQELVLIQVTCQISKLTMEYVVFSCTQGKIGGKDRYIRSYLLFNISLLCWFCCLHQVNSNCQLH